MSKINVKIDGNQHSFECPPGKTILEMAEDAGVDIPSSCQSGSCGACECRLVSGTVEMDDPIALSDQDIKDGLILACISKCTSDVLDIVVDG